MKLDLLTGKLYTDKDVFLKKLSCPEKIKASELKNVSDGVYNCSSCKNSVMDTTDLTDLQLLKILQQNPQQCLKININQPNLSIIKL